MPKPSPSSCSALAKVLALPELVEHILLHLDMYELFAAERVCTAFRNIIKRSRSIRQIKRLSYEPLDDKAFCNPQDQDIEKIMNPLLRLGTLPSTLMQFSFALYYVHFPSSTSFDSNIEIFAIASSWLTTEQVIGEHAVQIFSPWKSGSWEATKLTNTPAVVHFAMSDYNCKPITSFIMDGRGTLAELRDRLDKEMRVHCRAKSR